MAQGWPQHWPQPRARAGLGASITDFLAYTTPSSPSFDPNFASAWGDIQGQLQAEGADTSQINAAKEAMVNSFSQLASNTLGVTGDEAIAAAKQYVSLGQTVAGAVNMVQGLAAQADQQHSLQGATSVVVQAFTGTLIGAASAAGALSAGIGSAIVLGVGALLDALGAAGLFGPSGGFTLCNETLNSPPLVVVGCCFAFGGPANSGKVQPGSPNWRSFPVPNPATDNSQAGWFHKVIGGPEYVAPIGAFGGLQWTSTMVTDGSLRGIDIAFPHYHRICEVDAAQTSGPPGFLQAFAKAWMANAEFQLNGLQSQPDEQVLIHLLRLWNRAHDGPAVPIASLNGTYIQTLNYSAANYVQSSDANIVSGGQLIVNSGGLRAVSAPAPTPASSGASTAKTVAIVAAGATGAALVGSAAYSLAIGRSADWAIKALWRKLFIR